MYTGYSGGTFLQSFFFPLYFFFPSLSPNWSGFSFDVLLGDGGLYNGWMKGHILILCKRYNCQAQIGFLRGFSLVKLLFLGLFYLHYPVNREY